MQRRRGASSLLLLLLPLLLLVALLSSAAHAFIPSQQHQAQRHQHQQPKMSSVPISSMPTAPETQQRGRSGPFLPPLMSWYGEQRKRLQEQEQEAQYEWANKFNEFIVTQGPDLCVAGYEGYLRTGSKGAVAVYFDGDEVSLQDAPLEFTTLEELLSDDRMDEGVKEQLTERVTSYDPEAEVAILFAYKGQVGLNVIRPAYPPRYIFEMTKGKR